MVLKRACFQILPRLKQWGDVWVTLINEFSQEPTDLDNVKQAIAVLNSIIKFLSSKHIALLEDILLTPIGLCLEGCLEVCQLKNKHYICL